MTTIKSIKPVNCPDPSNSDDRALENVHSTPTYKELRALTSAELRKWLETLRLNLSPDDLRANTNRILEILQIASGLQGIEALAVELVVEFGERSETLLLGRLWYQKLLNLYNPVISQGNEAVQADFLKSMMRYFLQNDDPVRASVVIGMLIEIAEAPDYKASQDIMLAQATISTALESDANSVQLCDDLIELAKTANDNKLLGKVYETLAYYYSTQQDAVRAFEYGQMAYCIGIGEGDSWLAQKGLHLRASAFQVVRQPEKAIPMIRSAFRYCTKTKQEVYRKYLWYTWAASCYDKGAYAKAERYFRKCIAAFEAEQGGPCAQSVYTLGLCLMQQEKYEPAIETFERAKDLWLNMGRKFDIFFIEHALAELNFKRGYAARAEQMLDETIKQVEASNDPRHEMVAGILYTYLEKYRSAQPLKSEYRQYSDD